MKNRIQIMTVLLFSLFLASGCTGQKNDKRKSATSILVVKEKPEQKSPVLMKDSEKILVTFIELGSVKCIPCKMMQPIMEEIEKEYAGQVAVVFHDVWTEQGRPYAEQYKIRAIPTQIFLDQEGKEYYRHEGFFPKEELVKVLRMKGVQ